MTYKDIVRFGGNCQVCAYRGEALLRHCRSGCHRRCDLSLHRHEQRGTGRQEHLSPQKLAENDKKGNETKVPLYQSLTRIFCFSDF